MNNEYYPEYHERGNAATREELEDGRNYVILLEAQRQVKEIHLIVKDCEMKERVLNSLFNTQEKCSRYIARMKKTHNLK